MRLQWLSLGRFSWTIQVSRLDGVLVLRLPCQIEDVGRTTCPLRVALSKVDKGLRVLPVEERRPVVSRAAWQRTLSGDSDDEEHVCA